LFVWILGVWRYLQNDNQGWASTFLFVVCRKKTSKMDIDLRVINFPDKVFKKYLIDNFDKDDDGEISLTEALTITKVLCSQRGINSIAGIEFLSNLEILDCSRNNLEYIDISKNKALRHLSCYGNPLKNNLDIQNNHNLISLYCRECNLNYLNCLNNRSLKILSCGFNPLEYIDLSNNGELTMLSVRRCKLDELDVQSLKELQTLDCSENQLYSLDVRECNELISLNCACNDLHYDLYLGNNLKLKNLDCRKNINLYSITVSDGQHIENVQSRIRPTTISYRQYLEWKEYREEQLNDSLEYKEDWEDQRLDAFEGDESNYWNID
jgi:hypothetical protein